MSCSRSSAATASTTFIAAAEVALAAKVEPWVAFAGFMGAIVAADTHSLTVKLAGTFETTDELRAKAGRANELATGVFDRAAATIRPDVEVTDLGVIFEQLAAVRGADDDRTAQLRARYLALFLDALRHDGGDELPGPPPRPGSSPAAGSAVPDPGLCLGWPYDSEQAECGTARSRPDRARDRRSHRR